MAAFSYDPIARFGRENCTVAALREQALHVDTAPMSRGGLSPGTSTERPVTSADIKKILSHV
jgi:hypothetical protein